MLRFLTIRDYALIDDIELAFDAGMTALLGETGAGKSIIIDALAASLGGRVSADAVRAGARKAVVEAHFQPVPPSVRTALAGHDLDWDGDDVVFRREVTAAGTSRCFVNDSPVTATVARQLSAALFDFHGQHDTHGLLQAGRHLDVVDALADLDSERSRMLQAWERRSIATAALSALQDRLRHADADRARLQFIHDEIAAIAPVPGEDETVRADLERAEGFERIVGHVEAGRDALYAASPSAHELLARARTHIGALTPYSSDVPSFLQEIDSAIVACEEAAKALLSIADPADATPERIEQLRQRQVVLQRLVRKYGSLDGALTAQAEAAREAAGIDHLHHDVAEAQTDYDLADTEARTIAATLSQRRRAVLPTLGEQLSATLHRMGMTAATVTLDHQTGELGPRGTDTITMLFSGNAGEPPRPLAKVASGGELSRLMLAIKKAMADRGTVATMIFDEIDTGISGRVASRVGAVMRELAARHQILCITHLPQIAALADHFVRVHKDVADGKTVVSATRIDTDEATHDVARLLSGVDVTSASLESARELMSPSKETSR